MGHELIAVPPTRSVLARWRHRQHSATGKPFGLSWLSTRPRDAFRSSNIGFLLTNLNVRNIVLIGGHTEAFLGKTALTAQQRGFHTLCVVDATFNARVHTTKGNRQVAV